MHLAPLSALDASANYPVNRGNTLTGAAGIAAAAGIAQPTGSAV